jgi:hypothetical protein
LRDFAFLLFNDFVEDVQLEASFDDLSKRAIVS